MATYQPLEPSITQSLNLPGVTFSTDTAVSFFTSVSLLWTLGIVACVAAAGFVWVRGGLYRMEASEAGIRKSNDEFKRGSLGLLGVMALFLIIYTVNKGLLLGEISLTELRVNGGGVGGGGELSVGGTSGGAVAGNPGAGSGVGGITCTSPTNTINAVSSGNICGSARCTALSNCNYQQYLPIINQQAAAQGVDPRILIVLMCKESRALQAANNRNPNGTYDCGLMQVNQAAACTAADLDPTTNISRAASLVRTKMSATNRVYAGVPAIANLFASYNCCANGDNPASQSADCNATTGFNTSIPKWACPINPGTGQYNMCNVSSYACELTACLNSL